MSNDNSGQSEFCQSFACALQSCLHKNTYNPDKCEKVLNKLKQCCLEHGARSPVVCSGFPTSKSSSSK
ncbi:unnamed protein product [Rotaria magnacalcarata]|uniref:Cx9C motif-containing protein 4 n=1 Tax=Rotaria magnacalcarata TaxID=392030 RepID=A0A815XWG9_9BILA|nr:unnamed protein product [Rotaria magnacalcarata]CAF1562597.1 unnamed protein product [Rotaria magnacalcarata]CAF2005809.1 unnamed protein product [Rotaria magnacalcarata]CAF2062671.1 unnamed protein product [Rotaria magnacalcarata]CAF2126597.1 unnamed protein product [Rotaria magnacalcarata]